MSTSRRKFIKNVAAASAALTIGGLASGVYIYKMQAGSYIESKKMILMK